MTPMTNFATLAGAAIARGGMIEALAALTIPGFFIRGVMIAAFLTAAENAPA